MASSRYANTYMINSLENRVNEIVKQSNNTYYDTFQPSFKQNPEYCKSIVNLLHLTQNLKQDLLQNVLNHDPYNKDTSHMYNKACILECELNNLVRSIRPMRMDQQMDAFTSGSPHHPSSYVSKTNFASDHMNVSPNYFMMENKNRKAFTRKSKATPSSLYNANMYFERVPSEYVYEPKRKDSFEEVLYYLSSSSDTSDSSINGQVSEMPNRQRRISGRVSEIPNRQRRISDQVSEIPNRQRRISGRVSEIPNRQRRTKDEFRGQQEMQVQKSPHKRRQKIYSKKKKHKPNLKFGIYKSEPRLDIRKSTSYPWKPESEVFLVKKKVSPNGKMNKTSKKDRFLVTRLKKVKASDSGKNDEHSNQPQMNEQTSRLKSHRNKKQEKKQIKNRRAEKQVDDEDYLSKNNSKPSFEVREVEVKRKVKPKRSLFKSKQHIKPEKGRIKENKESVVAVYSYATDVSKSIFSREMFDIDSNLSNNNFTQTSNEQRISSSSRGKCKLKDTNCFADNNTNEVKNSFQNRRQKSGGNYDYNKCLLKIDDNNALSVLVKNPKSNSRNQKQNTIRYSNNYIRKDNHRNDKSVPFGDSSKAPLIYVTTVPDVQGSKKYSSNKTYIDVSNAVNSEYYHNNSNTDKVLRDKAPAQADDFSNSRSGKCKMYKLNKVSPNISDVKRSKQSISDSFTTKIPLMESQISIYQLKDETPIFTAQENTNMKKNVWPIPKAKSKLDYDGNDIGDQSANLQKRSLSKIWAPSKRKSKASVVDNNVTDTQYTNKKTGSKIKRLSTQSKTNNNALNEEVGSAVGESGHKGAKRKSIVSLRSSKVNPISSDDQPKSLLKKTSSWAKMKNALKATRKSKKAKKEKEEVPLEKTESSSDKSGKSKSVLKRVFSKGKKSKSKDKSGDKSKEPRSVSGYFDETPGSVLSLTEPFESIYQDPNIQQNVKSNLGKASETMKEPCEDKKQLSYSLHYTKEKHRCFELDSIPSSLCCRKLINNCKTSLPACETVISEHLFTKTGKSNNFNEVYIIPKNSSRSEPTYQHKKCKICPKTHKTKYHNNYGFLNTSDCSNDHTEKYFKKVPLTVSDGGLSDCSSGVDWKKIACKIRDC